MAIRLPGLQLTAEYRGVQPGGEFDRDGETIAFGPKLKFEVEDAESGDVMLLPLRASDLDKAQPPFDHSLLKRGDVVQLELTAVIGGAEERSYLVVKSAAFADGRAGTVPAVKAA